MSVMRLSQLTEELLEEIFLLYDRVVGGQVKKLVFGSSSILMSERLERIHEEFEKGSSVLDHRFGSKLKGGDDEHAKLVVWWETTKDGDKIVRFSFDPNLVSGEEAERLTKEFEREIDYLLFSKDLALFPEWDREKRKELEALEADIEQELQETTNNWTACFVSELAVTESDLSFKVRAGEIEGKKGNGLQAGIELLKLRIRNLAKQYSLKQPLPPTKTRELLLNDLAVLKELIGWELFVYKKAV